MYNYLKSYLITSTIKKKINKILYVFLFVSYEEEITRNNTNFLCMKQFVIYVINVSYKIKYCGSSLS